MFFFFFKQKTAYEMRISDWSSDVCSSDLAASMVACISLVMCRIPVSSEGGKRRQIWASAQRKSRNGALPVMPGPGMRQIGRASCRDRVCQYVLISVVAGTLTQKIQYTNASVANYTIVN